MILITSTGLVVAAGTITSDDNYFYCNNFAFPKNGDYAVVDVEMPSNMQIWHCNYIDGEFMIIPEPEPEEIVSEEPLESEADV